MITKYKKLDLKLTIIPAGEKGPDHEGWNHTPTPYKKFNGGDYNVGLLHSHSRTCCFDIDDLETARKIPDFDKLYDAGIKYTSGKANRVKIIFRIPKKYPIEIFQTWTFKFEGTTVGQFRCADRNGGSVQDVVPPSKHPEGTDYEWLDILPSKWKELPVLPKQFIKLAKERKKVQATATQRYQSEALAKYVKVYNDWFHAEGNDLGTEIMKTGGYIDMGMGRYKRKGSSNKQAIMVYSDQYGQFGVNYSDTEGPNFIKQGAFDAYDLLVHNKYNGNERLARHFVTAENPVLKKLCDTVNDDSLKLNIEGDVELLRTEGILYDPLKGFPYLSTQLMFPGEKVKEDGSLQFFKKEKDRKNENKFSRIVKSILWHQEGVYNPDMAFWYSLVFVDYLAGCGYESVNSSRTAPLYVFTAGDSSDGKSSTMQSGEKHMVQIQGKGNMSTEDARISVDDDDGPAFTTDYVNKRVIKNVGSAQGLEDIITSQLNHGCDVIFTQDEYGLRDNGTIDSAGKAMRSLLLSYRTLSRYEAVEPRALATTQKAKSITRNETYCVHFNYFTAATNETLRGVIRDSEVGMGYIQRFVGGVSRSEHFGARRRILGDKTGKIDGKVCKTLKSIVQTSNKYSGYARTSDGYPVKMEKEAEKYLHDLSVICIESTDVKVKKLAENVQPIARARAIAENPTKPVITLEIAQWAHTIGSCSILYFEWLINKLKNVGRQIPLDSIAEWKITDYMYNKDIVDEDSAAPRTTIIRGVNFSRENIPATTYSPVWNALIEMGVIKKTRNKNKVDKATAYYLNMEAYEHREQQKEEE